MIAIKQSRTLHLLKSTRYARPSAAVQTLSLSLSTGTAPTASTAPTGTDGLSAPAAAPAKNKKKKLVIVGGVAGGATAAARLSRLSGAWDVTVIERSPDVSFANCGLPYYLGREIADRGKLSLQTPQSLSQQLGVDVRTHTEVTHIERTHKTVSLRDVRTHETHSLPYDLLLLSPGASPLRPALPGIDHPRVRTLRNLQDMDAMDALLQHAHCRRVVVVGAGFIGLELVEQLRRVGKTVHLVEKAPAVLPQADEEMAEFLHAPLVENGVALHLGDGLAGFAPLSKSQQGQGQGQEGVQVRLESGKTLDADLVCLCIGVRPESALAKDAQLAVSRTGHIVVNEFMQTSDPSIYAVGDAIETQDLVFPERKTSVALGNIANMQARIAADHMATGKATPYRGSLGTSIVRAFDNVLALTGWNEKRLRAAGIPYKSTTITTWSHASYYPGAMPVTMKLLFAPDTGRVLGAQAVGVDGVDKRIDVVATAITGGLTVEDLSLTQLTYSPPFGSARDVVNVAGLAARNIKDNLVHPSYSLQDLTPPAGKKEVKILDVRPKDNVALHPVPGALNIPFHDLNEMDLKTVLDKDVQYKTVCALGKTAYFSSRILENAGFSTSTLIGGLMLHDKPKADSATAEADSSSAGSEGAQEQAVPASVSIDCSGLSCPGPLLKLKESMSTLPLNATLHVTATDPGFKADVKAFAASNGLVLKELTTSKGVIKASLLKPGLSAQQEQQQQQPQTILEAATMMRGQQQMTRKGATIVVFSEEFDKVLASLVIANGAAAMGGDVTMFFTFWGLNALRDAQRAAKDPKKPLDAMFGMMMPKGKDKLPLSHMNFGGLGAEMLKYVMKSKNLPNLPDLLASAKQQNIRFVACTMSMEAMGITAEELIDGVEYGGVAEYLAAAEKSGTNLFI